MCIVIWQLQELIRGQFTSSAHYHTFLPIWLCDGLKGVICNMTMLLTARFLPSWAWTAFLVLGLYFFLISLPFFLSHFKFYCCFVSPLPFSLLFTNFSFFFFPPLFLLFLFPAISHRFFFCSSCSTQTLLPSSLPWFNTERHPPSEFQCYWIAHCSHLLAPLDFPLSFSPHYYVPLSLSPALGNFAME